MIVVCVCVVCYRLLRLLTAAHPFVWPTSLKMQSQRGHTITITVYYPTFDPIHNNRFLPPSFFLSLTTVHFYYNRNVFRPSDMTK